MRTITLFLLQLILWILNIYQKIFIDIPNQISKTEPCDTTISSNNDDDKKDVANGDDDDEIEGIFPFSFPLNNYMTCLFIL